MACTAIEIAFSPLISVKTPSMRRRGISIALPLYEAIRLMRCHTQQSAPTPVIRVAAVGMCRVRGIARSVLAVNNHRGVILALLSRAYYYLSCRRRGLTAC